MTSSSSSPRVEEALRAQSRRAVQRALGYRRPVLTLPEIQRVTGRLASFREERRPLRIAILRTYTTELLRPHWSLEAALAGIELDLYEAPLHSILQEGQAGSRLLRHEPETTFLLLQWTDLDPAFRDPLAELSESARDELTASAERRLASLVGPLRDALPGLLVVALLPRSAEPEAQPVADLMSHLSASLRALPAVHFFDMDETRAAVEAGGERFFDPRLWQAAQFPFSVAGAQSVVRGLFTCAWLVKGPLVKCIAVDADNTLWGGIVGEDGADGISPHVAFQRRLLELRQRGIVLALCSRNNWSDVQEVLAQHPDQLLREEHFAAVRVNWEPKAENLRSIAAELRLGLDSFLFVDDSPQECLLVEQQCPELMVVRAPESPAEIPFCLDGIPGLERLSRTEEDDVRARYYSEDRDRRRLEVQSATVDEYLASLRMVMTVGLDDAAAVGRIAQLTQKTNQFNLTTRRYTEAEIDRWVRDPDWLVAHFALSDVFGDSGIVGVAIVRGVSGPEPEFDTFLESCRVIGRNAEVAFLRAVLEWLRGRGAIRARGRFVPSAKNALVRNFWSEQGFREREGERGEEPRSFERELAGLPEATGGPISVIIAEHDCTPSDQKETG